MAPGISPSPRYQHAAVRESFGYHQIQLQPFVHLRLTVVIFHFRSLNARLHVSGGALGGGRMVEDSSSVAGWTGLT